MYKDPRSTGNNWKELARRVGNEVFRHFLYIVVSRLMEGDRLIFDDSISLFIGTIKNNPKGIAKPRKKRQIYFENPGYRRGIVLHGLDHEYFFRMPFRRRKELVERIKNGQEFYNQLNSEYVQAHKV